MHRGGWCRPCGTGSAPPTCLSTWRPPGPAPGSGSCPASWPTCTRTWCGCCPSDFAERLPYWMVLRPGLDAPARRRRRGAALREQTTAHRECAAGAGRGPLSCSVGSPVSAMAASRRPDCSAERPSGLVSAAARVVADRGAGGEGPHLGVVPDVGGHRPAQEPAGELRIVVERLVAAGHHHVAVAAALEHGGIRNDDGVLERGRDGGRILAGVLQVRGVARVHHVDAAGGQHPADVPVELRPWSAAGASARRRRRPG